MFFKIGTLKHFALFTRKQLCWTYFLIKRAAILLKRDFKTDVFLECYKIYTYFEEHLQTASNKYWASVDLIFLIKNIM